MNTDNAAAQHSGSLATLVDLDLFRILSEPARMDLIRAMLRTGRADVGTIAEHMKQDRSVVSRHLKLMREAGLVSCEKEGRHCLYALQGSAFVERLEQAAAQLRKALADCC